MDGIRTTLLSITRNMHDYAEASYSGVEHRPHLLSYMNCILTLCMWK